MPTLAERLKLKYAPASIRRTDMKPEGATDRERYRDIT